MGDETGDSGSGYKLALGLQSKSEYSVCLLSSTGRDWNGSAEHARRCSVEVSIPVTSEASYHSRDTDVNC